MPAVTVAGLQFAILLGGAILTEQTFNWPGIGSELIRYLNNRDYIAVQGIITVFALASPPLAADRRCERVHRPAREVLMAGPATSPLPQPCLSTRPVRRPPSSGALLGQIRQAEAMPKRLLYICSISRCPVPDPGDLRSPIAPYGSDQVELCAT